jgi:hypothetical protein
MNVWTSRAYMDQVVSTNLGDLSVFVWMVGRERLVPLVSTYVFMTVGVALFLINLLILLLLCRSFINVAVLDGINCTIFKNLLYKCLCTHFSHQMYQGCQNTAVCKFRMKHCFLAVSWSSLVMQYAWMFTCVFWIF